MSATTTHTTDTTKDAGVPPAPPEAHQRAALKWEVVAMIKGYREQDGADVVVRWRKHAPVGRLTATHAVDVRGANGRCVMLDQRLLTASKAQAVYEQQLKALSHKGFCAIAVAPDDDWGTMQ